MSKHVIEVVEKLALPIVEELSLELVEVEFVKEGRDYFLRVCIDSATGVDIDQCGAVSEQLSLKLDEVDPISENYFLEVCSPGAERPLKKKADVEAAVGKRVNVRTFTPIDEKSEFEGDLLSFEGDVLTIEVRIKTRKKVMTIPYENVANARLAIRFE